MKLARSVARLTAVVATGTLVVACGSTSEKSTDQGELDTSASMSLGVFSTPTSLDPVRARASQLSDSMFLSALYDQLLVLDKDLGIAPGLASEWEMSEDGKALDLTLRTDAVFHDGSAFDSEVVKANLDRARTMVGSTVASEVDSIERVMTDGPDRVRIEFVAPSFYFPYVLASNHSVSSMVSGEAIASGADLSRDPAGSGPFELANYGQDRITFARYDEYWDAENLPALAEATLISIPDDNARLSALQSGQIQVAAIRPNQSAAYADLVASGNVQKVPFGGQTYSVFINNTRPGLDDVRVRKAMSLAIDRQTISDSLFRGEAQPAYQFQVEGMDGYVAEIDEAEHYDPDQARKLLTEAGADGLEVTLLLNSTQPGDSIATVVQDQLARVGVTAKVMSMPPTSAGEAWRKGEAGMYVTAGLLGGDPMLFLERYMFGIFTIGPVDDEITSSYADATTLHMEDPDRGPAFAELTTLLDEKPVHLPVVRVPSQYLGTRDVVGLEDMTFSQLSSTPEIRVLGRTE